MREAIDTALACSCNTEDFEYALKKQGYMICLNTNHKYASICSYNSRQGTTLYRLGEAYDRTAIFARLNENLLYNRNEIKRQFEAVFSIYRYEWVDSNPPQKEYGWRKEFYNANIERASLLEIYVMLFVLILDLTVEAVKTACEALLPETRVPEYIAAACMKAKSPELKEATRFADRYTRQLMLMSEEKFQTTYAVRKYITEHERQIDEVKSFREHWQNKLSRAATPKETDEYTKKRNRCTELLRNLRFQKQTAQTILADMPEVRGLLKGEQNIQRGTDPYEVAMGYKMKDTKECKTLSR